MQDKIIISLVKLTPQEKEILERKLRLNHVRQPQNNTVAKNTVSGTDRINYPPQPQNTGRINYPSQSSNTGRINYPPQPQNTGRLDYSPQLSNTDSLSHPPQHSKGKITLIVALCVVVLVGMVTLIILMLSDNSKPTVKPSDTQSSAVEESETEITSTAYTSGIAEVSSATSTSDTGETSGSEPQTVATEEASSSAVVYDEFKINDTLFECNTNDTIRIQFYLKRLSKGDFAKISYRVEYNTEVFTLDEKSIRYYNLATDNHYENTSEDYGMDIDINSAVDGVVYNFDDEELFVEMNFKVKDKNKINYHSYAINARCIDLYNTDGNSVATDEEKKSYDLFTYNIEVS